VRSARVESDESVAPEARNVDSRMDVKEHRYAGIIAGGAGTRLWPLSRRARPKQLLPVAGGESLLEHAWRRVDGVVEPSRRLICTTNAFADAMRGALPELRADNTILEPMGRDTLNAVGLLAFVLAARDPRATLAILTADHLIEPVDLFRARLAAAFAAVESSPRRIATFGVAPTHAATGYGYIERGAPVAGVEHAFHATRFVEKPDRMRAEEYLRLGTFAWNSGMFVFAAATMREAIRRHAPACAAGLAEIADAWDSPARDDALRRVYPTLPKESFDRAIMEPAATGGEFEVCMLALGANWIDVGNWTNFADSIACDDRGNRANAHWLDDGSRGMRVISDDPGHLIATVGCEDLVIVHTKDATLIAPAAEVERVKALAERAPEAWR
jgi:mannose-1-phosphate guanylyltransferase